LAKEIVYISDYFVEHVLGGAEINDNVLLTEVLEANIERVQSHMVDLEFLKNNINNLFIISNFIYLSKDCKEYIQNNCKYIIYEHDHKYLVSRNPGLFEDFKAPSNEIVHLEFYTNALKVIAQSTFHKEIIEKNLNIKNVFSLGGNLWSEQSLKLLEELYQKPKNNICSVMNSNITHKNTRDAIKFCKFKKIPYALIQSTSYEEFLSLLSQNNQFAFFPKTPETLSRVVVEARMLGVKIYTNKLVGATHEPWFNSISGQELNNLMHLKKKEIKQVIENVR
jgi:hypothetical protein